VLAIVLALGGILTLAQLPRSATGATPSAPGRSPGASSGEATLLGTAPQTWDPALAGDAGTASTLAQVYEGLTAFDAESRVQPALASDWSVEEGGRRITFRLRPGITFSDGSPITAEDVVASWLRVIDPQRPGPLSALMADIEGATAYLRGEVGPDGVALRAEDDTVVVEFRRPASYFVAVTASPTLAVLPAADAAGREGPILPQDMVVSGGYVATSQEAERIVLRANDAYWAGSPSIADITILTDTGGQSPVSLFEAGQLDWTNVGSFDASWIRYDPSLGPQLRHTPSFSVDYYGFDTTRPPFDDVRIRQAFAMAVDWDRIVPLSGAPSGPATSLIPEGIPGRGDDDFSPVHDPDAARALLAEAAGTDRTPAEILPTVTLTSPGLLYDQAVVHELERELGIEVELELRPFDEYTRLLDDDTPAFWGLSWIADYPAPQDFLGLLLETGSASNEGGWSHAGFDAALEAAAATEDPAEQAAHYAEAQRIVRDEAPVIPVAYGESWSLSRQGLLGAGESGVGFLRYAGLAWADGT
jgi:oligopeptide transport system substrate-binding protein